MIISPILIMVVLAIGISLFLLGLTLKRSSVDKIREQKKKLYQLTKTEGVISTLNKSSFIQDMGSQMGTKNKEIEVLFRKSKNPWGLTPATYQFLRLILAPVCAVIGLGMFAFSAEIGVILIAIGACLFIIPKKKYEAAAEAREGQWCQLYQFMWIIKHNLEMNSPKVACNETAKYIDEHADNLPELVQGFHDFSDHWNQEGMDEYLEYSYGDFSIPKDLYGILANSVRTGTSANDQLTSLRRVIIEKMNYRVQQVLSEVSEKATTRSSPFLLASVSVVVLGPVILTILNSIG